MSRRSFAIATVLSVVTLGVPLTGCSNLLADAYFNNAQEKYDKGDFEDAIKLLDRAIVINEKFEYHYNRGVANLDLQNPDEAIKDLENHRDQPRAQLCLLQQSTY